MTKSNLKSILANGKNKLARKVGFGLLLASPFLLATSCKDNTGCDDPRDPACENYDPCYGVQDTYNTKKANEATAANNVRSTFNEIAVSGFGSAWTPAFPNRMNEYLQQTGIITPVMKDTAIVSKNMCVYYLDLMKNNEAFMTQIGPLMRNNIAADSTYIVTEEDLVNYYNQHQACITR